MALLWFDGLDTYASFADMGQVGWYTSGLVGFGFSTTGGRFGGCHFYSGNGGCQRAFFSTVTEFWTGFSFNAATVQNADVQIASFNSLSGAETQITFNGTTGEIKVWRVGTQIGTSGTGQMTASAWHCIEVRNKFSPTAGEMEVWVDGVRLILVTGVSTRTNAAATGFSSVTFGAYNSGVIYRIDDIYCLDTTGSAPHNARLGDFRVQVATPNSDAGPNNGTPQTGTSHYAMVNDAAGYNSSNYNDLTMTTGQEERYGVSALSGAVGTVYGIRVVAVGQKSDAGTANCHTKVVSGGAASSGTSWPLLTSYGYQSDIFLTDPKTGGAWTAAALAAMQVGIVVE